MPARPKLPRTLLTPRTTAYLYLILNTVTWGAALGLVKPALETTTPFRYLFYRYALACLLTVPLLWKFLRQKPKLASFIPTISWVELLGTTLSLGLLYAGLRLTTSIEASLLLATQPITITLAGILFLREREEKREWIGLLIALAGTLLLAAEPLFSGVRVAGSSAFGNGLVLTSTLVTAVYFIVAKKKYHTIPKLFSASISFYIGLISFFVLSLFELVHTQSQNELVRVFSIDFHSPAVWLAAGYMAIFGSIIGLTAYLKGQDLIEASEASIFMYLQPLVALPIGYFFLGEKLLPAQFAALFLIILGVIWSQKMSTATSRKAK